MPTPDNLRDQIAAALEDAPWSSTLARVNAVLPIVQAAITEARREACPCYPDPRDHEEPCPYAAGGTAHNGDPVNPYDAGSDDTETAMEDWAETDEILADPVTLDLIEQGEADLAGGTTPTSGVVSPAVCVPCGCPRKGQAWIVCEGTGMSVRVFRRCGHAVPDQKGATR